MGGGQASTGLPLVGPPAFGVAALYQSEHLGNDFSYQFPLPSAGTYTAFLLFSEIFWETPGSRMFDVLINGTTVLPALDIVKVAGGRMKPLYYKFVVSFPEGPAILTIRFVAIRDNAKVSSRMFMCVRVFQCCVCPYVCGLAGRYYVFSDLFDNSMSNSRCDSVFS